MVRHEDIGIDAMVKTFFSLEFNETLEEFLIVVCVLENRLPSYPAVVHVVEGLLV